jgi:exonuclease III
MIGNAATAARLTGHNVRGLTPLKLEKAVRFMKERRLLVSVQMETWIETPQGWTSKEIDGFLVIYHGETAKSCNRGRNGVAIILSPEARAAWELGGSWIRHSSNGRVLTVRLTIEGGKTFTVCGAYAPTSGNTSAARQSFYDDVSVQTRSENQSDVLALFIDGNASMGVGARPGTRQHGEPRALGPWGNRHVNAAGQEMREWLQIEGLASARTFFRPKGDRHDTWWHPKSKLGYSLDQILVRGSQIGRVQKACTCSEVAVASDHVPTYLELHVGRMQRRQKAVNQTKPANIAALRDPETRRTYAEAVGSAMGGWGLAHPTASLEERAEAFRVIPLAKALEVCGKRERREEGWFAAHREVLMELVAVRNRAEAAWRRQQGQAAHARLKEARKALKREVHVAKVTYMTEKIAGCSGGQKCYWEAVRAINSGDDSRATAVAVQKFLDSDGNVCSTPAENADAAAKHFTKVYNITRERPPGAEEAVNSVKQRPTMIDLDAPISESELDEVLKKAKPGKATSNGVAVELLQACSESPEAFRLLHGLVADVFEKGREAPPAPAVTPSDGPAPDLATMSQGERHLYLVQGAKDHGWRCQWQVENPKGGLSKDRYALYCGAATYADAIGLGMKSGVKSGDALYDLNHGYLQIFPDSLRVETLVEEDEDVEGGSDPGAGPVTALLEEFARMRLKMLPKKGDLRDLNNWRGIMLLDAASKVISMVVNSRLQRLLKEVGIEEQNGFMGGRGCADGSFCIRQALKKRREHGLESWVLFVDLVKAFDSVPRDVLFTVLAKFGVPPHLISVIKRMNTDLEVTFELNGENVAVPCSVGVKQGCPLSPTLFLFVMQACLESLEEAMPADAKLQFQTNTRTEGRNGGHVSGTDWSNKGEFTFSFWASLYADDAATPLASRAALLAATNAIYDHLRLFGLLMHVGSNGKRSKTEAMYCPARTAAYGDGDTSDLVLDCGGTIGFAESFVYLGSLLHCDLSDHHDVEARIKKASQAFGALRSKIFGSADIPERLKGKVYSGGVLAVLLYGCESWCLKAESVRRLSNWHNKRVREMCRVTMCQTFVHRITSESLQKRTGVFSLEHYLASRTLLWAGHVARMPKNRLPKRLMLSWVQEPRVAGGQEVTYGRSLQRHLNHFDLPTVFTEWAHLAQDRAGWHTLVTTPPFAIGKPFVRQPRGDTRVTPEDKQRAVARRAAEVSERRAAFDANNNN